MPAVQLPPNVAQAASHLAEVDAGAAQLDLIGMAPMAIDILTAIAARVSSPIWKATLNAAILVLRAIAPKTAGGPPQLDGGP